MFGYQAMLGPEARSIVQYLVSEVGLDNTASAREIRERLDLSETELSDGIEELAELGSITVHGPYIAHSAIEPKGGAWLYVDDDTVGFDLRADMLGVAECVASREQAEPQEIEADTGLSVQRLNVAALALQHEGNVHLVMFHGRDRYSFNEARATRETRRYVRENQA